MLKTRRREADRKENKSIEVTELLRQFSKVTIQTYNVLYSYITTVKS
jgi:hypothetical protein